ncbi:hypothetical protein LCGC14_0658570 [marine sediment metagenome]|uniref:Uncharacterized protein n=1 Tax=marine sediment metagenome TaxID=412755 RepID=A0A0F9QZD7_9ZZZZ
MNFYGSRKFEIEDVLEKLRFKIGIKKALD